MDCVCNICSKRFPNQEKLGLHQYRIHSDKPFQCKLYGEKGNGANQYSNHMRKHKEPKSIQCEICQYESTDASNMNKHKKRHSLEKLEKVSKSTQNSCEPCGKTFPRKANFERHMKVHLKKKAETFDCNQCDKGFTRKDNLTFHSKVHRDKVETEMGFGTFGKEKERKVKLRKRFMCEKCAKTFTSDANLQRHCKTETHNQKKKVRNNRWKVMRHVKKLLEDAQYANELKKKTNVSDTGCIDGELVESIMCNIPNISNRNILRTLTILRRKLPKKHFQANLKKVIQQRTNLLEDLAMLRGDGCHPLYDQIMRNI